MQTELLNRKRWKTRIELANAIFDYLEIFHNRQRRHSALGMRTPIEFELLKPIRPTRGLKPSMATPPNTGHINEGRLRGNLAEHAQRLAGRDKPCSHCRGRPIGLAISTALAARQLVKH
jgi:hypothetical protein